MTSKWARRIFVLGAGVLALGPGCGGRVASKPHDPEVALRREVAMLEARRGASVDALVGMVTGGDPAASALAARALGRVGGARAQAALLAQLRCGAASACRPGQLAAAAAALGLAGALEEPEPAAVEQVSAALVSALDTAAPGVEQAVLAEALGRTGTAEAQPVLAARLAGGGALGEAAAVALGRHGRRKLPWSAEVRAQVVAATAHAERALRFAATWALAREYQAPGPVAASVPGGEDGEEVANAAAVAAALAARLGDANPEVRAIAAQALARRKLAGRAAPALVAALRDPDWRVAVEAVRALGGSGEAAHADALAEAAMAQVAGLTRAPAGVQVLVEALRQLAGHGGRAQVASQLSKLRTQLDAVRAVSPVAAGWTRCLVEAALERAQAAPVLSRLASCGGGELPQAYAATVVVDAVTGGAGGASSATSRRAAIELLWSAADARVRAAALTALPTLAAEASDAEAAADVDRVAVTVAATEAMLAGEAIEVAGKLVPVPGADPAATPPAWSARPLTAAALGRLTQAVVARAGRERDPELAGALLDFLAERKLASGAGACQAAARDASPVIARAGQRCQAALSPVAAPPAAAPDAAQAAPPIELGLGLLPRGQRWRWIVTTNLGEVEIELDGAAAPWHVATVVALTRRGFYDGLDFHRVVPNFVVQGGDPTESGSGGPGFSLPAEPGSMLDGDSYRAGAVGFADAGKDSGGSQWFVMHSRSPHLEGRYTRIGQLRRGQDVIDRLLVGDHVVSARVVAE